MTGGRRGWLLLRAQSRKVKGPEPLGPPPRRLDRQVRAAWHDIVAAAPDVLCSWDQLGVGLAASILEQWRSGECRDVRLAYRILGDLFISMRDRRRLLFPERPRRA